MISSGYASPMISRRCERNVVGCLGGAGSTRCAPRWRNRHSTVINQEILENWPTAAGFVEGRTAPGKQSVDIRMLAIGTIRFQSDRSDRSDQSGFARETRNAQL